MNKNISAIVHHCAVFLLRKGFIFALVFVFASLLFFTIGQIVINAQTAGNIQGYKVMPGNQPVVPAAGNVVWLDIGDPYINTFDNPYFFTNIPAGSQRVHVSVPSGYGVGYTLCYNEANCHENAPTPLTVFTTSGGALEAVITVNVPAGGYADLWWHYAPSDVPPASQPPPASPPPSQPSQPPSQPPPAEPVADCSSGYGASSLSAEQKDFVWRQLTGSVSEDVANAFFYNVIPCESSWRANAEAQGPNCYAVGLYQLEDKTRTGYTRSGCGVSHKDENWTCQTPSAVDVYVNRGSGYWQCWP